MPPANLTTRVWLGFRGNSSLIRRRSGKFFAQRRERAVSSESEGLSLVVTRLRVRPPRRHARPTGQAPERGNGTLALHCSMGREVYWMNDARITRGALNL